MAWEFNLLDQIQQHLANDFLNALVPRISSLGDAGLIWIALSILLLLFPKTRKAGLASGIALLFMLITGNMILKPLVARLRPFTVNTAVELLIPPPTDFQKIFVFKYKAKSNYRKRQGHRQPFTKVEISKIEA